MVTQSVEQKPLIPLFTHRWRLLLSKVLQFRVKRLAQEHNNGLGTLGLLDNPLYALSRRRAIYMVNMANTV